MQKQLNQAQLSSSGKNEERKKDYLLQEKYTEELNKYGFSIINHVLPDGAYIIGSFIPRSICDNQISLLISLQHN